ncbi:MAG TPA: bifunctional lysylphosphatidylglycerol flippase/synthetase MprF, partial [Nitrospirae bacterium]|nr:bifunctional lysylphosphatidylglycerol flippase/synthetase MprF [Nitrospirota bacterium]
LAYRAIYYILPLIASVIFLGIFEIVQRRRAVAKTLRIFGRLITVLTPHVLTFGVFAGGVILLISGATPALESRLALLRGFVPEPVLEASHFLGSLAGAGLIILARGLQRRLDASYILTLILLGAGVVFSLLKGFDYEEAIILLVMFCALLTAHRHFYRKASLIGQKFTPGWTAAISTVLICTAWLGIFSYKHIEYSNNLWWQFTFTGDAPRFLRAAVGTACVVLFFAIAKLFRPAAPESSLPGLPDLEKVSAIAAMSRNTLANLALLGDKPLLFSESGSAFIMYGVEGRSWIAMGDPVGRQEETAELAWRFREMSDRHNGWTVFYEVGTENLQVYLDLGLTFVKLGEDGRVLLETFSLAGHERKDMRHVLHKLDREGCSFEIITQERIPAILPELKRISDAWLAEKNTREKGFSLGFFSEDYLTRFPAAVVKREDKIIAFANIWAGAGKEELSIDLMRYLPDAPHGLMDYLFIRLILWGKQEGYKWFNLGMAPLSGLEDRALAPLWSRLGAFVFRHGEHFYNCQGLRQYKEKFDPEWKPKYLAYPGGFSLPRILANIASLISRGLAGIITKYTKYKVKMWGGQT